MTTELTEAEKEILEQFDKWTERGAIGLIQAATYFREDKDIDGAEWWQLLVLWAFTFTERHPSLKEKEQ